MRPPTTAQPKGTGKPHARERPRHMQAVHTGARKANRPEPATARGQHAAGRHAHASKHIQARGSRQGCSAAQGHAKSTQEAATHIAQGSGQRPTGAHSHAARFTLVRHTWRHAGQPATTTTSTVCNTLAAGTARNRLQQERHARVSAGGPTSMHPTPTSAPTAAPVTTRGAATATTLLQPKARARKAERSAKRMLHHRNEVGPPGDRRRRKPQARGATGRPSPEASPAHSSLHSRKPAKQTKTGKGNECLSVRAPVQTSLHQSGAGAGGP